MVFGPYHLGHRCYRDSYREVQDSGPSAQGGMDLDVNVTMPPHLLLCLPVCCCASPSATARPYLLLCLTICCQQQFRQVRDQERNVADDGGHYTWDQFVQFYGDDAAWYWLEASRRVGDGAVAESPNDDEPKEPQSEMLFEDDQMDQPKEEVGDSEILSKPEEP